MKSLIYMKKKKRMNFILYIAVIIIYLTNIHCKNVYNIKKLSGKNNYKYNKISNNVKRLSNMNPPYYKRKDYLNIRMNKKTIQNFHTTNQNIHYKKFKNFVNKSKNKNKLYYLYIPNNDTNSIKGKKNKQNNKVLEIYFQKKKLLAQYFNNLKSSFIYKLKNTKIITKLFLSSSLLILTLNVIGLKPEDIALHSKRVLRAFEFYRIYTSALFYGDISLYVLTNIYMLYVQSNQLENILGSSEMLSYYISQISILSIICSYIKKPFYSTALLKSLLFVNCMLNPYQKANLIFGININNMYLPYLSILIDIIHAQNLKASISGLLGVTSGSIYYLLNIYLYDNYNKKVFKIPKFLETYLDSYDTIEIIQ